jgi:hypothetical protein
MNFRDAYEFDPKTYGDQGAGGLLRRLQAMMRQGQAGADPGSNAEVGSVYDPDAYASQQGGLIGRLREPQQQQAEDRPRATQGGSRLADQIVRAESHGDPNAENMHSTARGAGQFLEETWLEMLAKHRPDLTGSRADLLALRNDPKLATEMTAAYAAENARKLSNAGHEATPGNIYLMHFAGPSGGVAVLNADPNVSVRSVLGEKAIADNPFLGKMTIGDMRAWADRKMRATSVHPSRPVSPTFPERADPIFPQQASPQPERRLVRTSAGDQSWLLSPSPVARQPGIDLASDEGSRRQPLVGLISGEPMQHWMVPIFKMPR